MDPTNDNSGGQPTEPTQPVGDQGASQFPAPDTNPTPPPATDEPVAPAADPAPEAPAGGVPDAGAAPAENPTENL